MGYFIEHDTGSYYEGDRISYNDIECVKQPSPYHTYDIKMKRWELDNKKVLKLKSAISAQINDSYKVYTSINNLTDDERERIDNIYNATISTLMNATAPEDIEKIKLVF